MTPRYCARVGEGLWFQEDPFRGTCFSLRIDRLLLDEDTGEQHLLLFENEAFGRVLALDGVVQVCEADEHVYHEMIAHVPILAHGAARSVAIVGGGDGGVLREVLRHRSVERAVLVEIDESVIAFSREHLPFISAGAFDDPRAEIMIADGAAYMDAPGEAFDVIIIDSTDPEGPGAVLFTQDFYAACKARLAPGGVMVNQSGVSFLQPDVMEGTAARLARLFAHRTLYTAPTPSYVGGVMALGFATDAASRFAPELETLRSRFDAAGLATRHYSPEVHKAAFALAPEVLRRIG